MHKEDGGFSLVVLSLAVVLYIAVLCMTFAGMIVTRPTVSAAFFEFTKDYGSLLAGIPVLIAVLVAKQQLDANRRQHAVQLYETKQSELDALQGLVAYLDQLLRERDGAFTSGRDLTTPDLNLTYRISMHTQFSVSSSFSRLTDEVDDYNKTDRRALALYGGEESGETIHGARCSELFGGVKVFRGSALQRIAQIQLLSPSTQTLPSCIR